MIWVTFFSCLLLSFIFSGIEAGVLNLNRVRLRHRAREGDASAQQLDRLLLNSDRLLGTVIVVNATASMSAFSIIIYSAWAWGGLVACLGAVLVFIPLFALFLEFLPRALFRHLNYRTLVVFARILTTTDRVLGPLIMPLIALLRVVTGSRTGKRNLGVSTLDQMKLLTIESVERGEISRQAHDFLLNALAFRNVKAGEIMIPMRDVISVSSETSVTDVLQLAKSKDIDRLPVLDRRGSVLGLINVFDLLIDGIQSGRAQSHVRRLVSVSPDETGHSVLRKMRAARMTLAVVQSPDSPAPQGILSTEDLVQKMLRG